MLYLTCYDFSQVVDDEQQHTLVAASTLMPEIRGQLNGTGGANKVTISGATISQLLLYIYFDKSSILDCKHLVSTLCLVWISFPII